MYPSSNFLDDLAFGAAWLYRKTGEEHFLDVCFYPVLPIIFSSYDATDFPTSLHKGLELELTDQMLYCLVGICLLLKELALHLLCKALLRMLPSVGPVV